jgi:integrase
VQADVARLAGVSAQTVSRVINETGYVGARTRERVLSAVRELNYRALSERGREDVEWRLGHLLAYFRDMPVSEFTVRAVDEYRAAKLAERDHPERLPGKRRPLGNRSINMTLVLLAQILDIAVEYGLLDANPAQGRRRRLPQQKPTRNFLEPDMVVDLLDAAGDWERQLPPHQRYGRRALLALLCLAGPRIAEATTYERGQLDLHAGVLRGGLKTAAGRNRTIDLTALLLEELRSHVAGLPTAGGLLFPSRSGQRLSAHNVRTRLLRGGPGRTLKDGSRSRTKGVVERANVKRAAEGRLLIPDGVTPHTLRRTFASLCFFAGRDARLRHGPTRPLRRPADTSGLRPVHGAATHRRGTRLVAHALPG